MNHKKLSLIAIPLFVLLASIIYITKTFNLFGAFLFDFLISLTIIFIFFLFAKQESLRSWLKFAIIFMIIVIILIVISPTTGDSLRLIFGKKEVALFSAVVFSVMSVVLILIKSFRPNWRLWLALTVAFIFSLALLIIAGLIL